MDLLIASHALSLKRTLVSSDQAYGRVQTLTCIDPLQTGVKMG